MRPTPKIRSRFIVALLALGLALAVFAPRAQAQTTAPVVQAVEEAAAGRADSPLTAAAPGA